MSKNNAAYGVPLKSLSVVVVEQSKAMQHIMRSVLTAIKVSRVRVFDNAQDAVRAMYAERPHVILTDLLLEPTSGIDLMNLMRRPDMVPLCYVPVVAVTSATSHSSIIQALEAGAHYVLSKPVSPARVEKILRWISTDSRLIAMSDARFEINGMSEMVESFKRSAGANEIGDSNGFKFPPPAVAGLAGETGLKFHREDSNEAMEQRLRFAKESGAQSANVISSANASLESKAGKAANDSSEIIEKRKTRAHSGFAPLSR